MNLRDSNAFQILCVGDSLTAGSFLHSSLQLIILGYSHMGSMFTPYGEFLEEKSSGGVEVDVIGMSGWTSTNLLNTLDKHRIVDVCRRKSVGLRFQLQQKQYQLVMLMIGTNDIGTDVSVDELFENICKLREVILQFASNIVLFTIPSSRYFKEIAAINERIVKFVQENSADGHTFLFDCHTLFHDANVLALSDSDAHEMVFDFDRLHFTEYGSKLLGETLYSKLNDFGVTFDDSQKAPSNLRRAEEEEETTEAETRDGVADGDAEDRGTLGSS
jgi:lysophospholipase L1-like esterase